jgi:hypothetical protein
MHGTGSHQLLHAQMLIVTVRYFGSQGHECSFNKIQLGLDIYGKGTVQSYVDQTVNAILSLEKDVLFWPDEAERKLISERIEQHNNFPKCVGIVDGTHICLVVKPQL